MIYDLAIIGNGISAQTFLWQLSHEFSENPKPLSLAHIYADHLFMPCTHHSCATVSLNGISPDVSPLGNDMREAYFSFLDFYQKNKPMGVEEVERTVIGTNSEFLKKLTRRYKRLDEINSHHFQQKYFGTKYPSFLIDSKQLSDWFAKEWEKKSSSNLVEKNDLRDVAKDIRREGEHYLIDLAENISIRSKKVIFFTGAYAKILGSFFTEVSKNINEDQHAIRPGSFLEKNIDLNLPSFYLSIDDAHILYRSQCYNKKLIIGNVSGEGPFAMADYESLSTLLNKFESIVTFPLGKIDDYKIVTGLRHKGPKRMMIVRDLNSENSLFYVNGFYKNGFTFSFLSAKRLMDLLFGKNGLK